MSTVWKLKNHVVALERTKSNLRSGLAQRLPSQQLELERSSMQIDDTVSLHNFIGS
jgi:hypothetical protein